MILKISNFDIWSIVKVSFVLSLVIIFLISVFLFLIIGSVFDFGDGSIEDQAFGGTNPFSYAKSYGGALLFFALIIYSVIFAFFQTFVIALTFWLYNALSGYIGEIKVTVSEEELEVNAEDQSPVRSE